MDSEASYVHRPRIAYIQFLVLRAFGCDLGKLVILTPGDECARLYT
jgi:hypothetical protein